MSADRMMPGVEALRQQLQSLQDQHARGAIGADAWAEARRPLERLLVDAVLQPSAAGSIVGAGSAATAPSAQPRPSWRLQAGLSLTVLVLALLGYGVTGSPGSAVSGLALPAAATAGAVAGAVAGAPAGNAAGNPASPPDFNAAPTEAQVAEIVDRLAQRLKDQPDDAVGWALLARAYSAMGRFAEAVPAYDKVLALAPETADLLADSADAMAGVNNGKLTAQALLRIERALVLDPDNVKALALSGSSAFDQRDYVSAVRQWQKAERAMPAESAFRSQLLASLAEARELGGLPADARDAGAAPATGAAKNAAKNAATNAATNAVSGHVTLDPALAASVGPNDTVFVFARAAAGPRMPLAVLRKQVKDLPFDFSLDDSMAMAPDAKISGQTQLVVSARISKRGDAMPQAGDLTGQSSAVAPGTRGIALRIGAVLAAPARP